MSVRLIKILNKIFGLTVKVNDGKITGFALFDY